MPMEAGGLNVKADPEGTHKEGTRVQEIPGQVIQEVVAGGHELNVGGMAEEAD